MQPTNPEVGASSYSEGLRRSLDRERRLLAIIQEMTEELGRALLPSQPASPAVSQPGDEAVVSDLLPAGRLEALLQRQVELTEKLLARLERVEIALVELSQRSEQPAPRPASATPQPPPQWERAATESRPAPAAAEPPRESGPSEPVTTRLIIRGIRDVGALHRLEEAVASAPGVVESKPVRYAVGAIEFEVTYAGHDLASTLASLNGFELHLRRQTPTSVEVDYFPEPALA